MNLYHLRYFLTLAHYEHYSRAAEELMITQPSLSHAISNLEKKLGVSLFEKDGRNMVITKYGKVFYSEVEKAVDIIDSAVHKLQLIGKGSGIIDLGFLPTLATDFLPEMIQDFLKAYPDNKIDFRFYTDVTGPLIQGLKEKRYDIIFSSKVSHEQNIEFIPIAKQELVLIVPRNHPLAEKDAISLEETLPYPLVYFSHKSGIRPIVDNLYKKIDKTPKIAYEVLEDQVIAGLVEQNFGIGIVPNMVILKHLDLKIVTIKKPTYERNFYLAILKNSYLSPAVKNFKDYVIEHSKI